MTRTASRRLIRRVPAAAVAALLAALATGVVLAGCSGGSANSGAGGSAARPDTESGPAAASTVAGRNAELPTTSTAAPSITPASSSPSAAAGRLLTRSGTMELSVPSPLTVAAKVAEQVDELGGYVTADSSLRPHGGSDAVVRATYAVPSARFDAFRAAVRRLGPVTSETVRTTDVTDGVVDLTSRIATQKQSLARIRALFAKATDLTDISTIEAQLTSREADLESMESQLATTRSQVALSTLDVTIVTAPPRPKPVVHQHKGFVSGFHSGWHGLSVTAVAGSRVVGAILPFAVPLALLVAVTLLVVRRVRRPRSGDPGSSEPPVDAAGA